MFNIAKKKVAGKKVLAKKTPVKKVVAKGRVEVKPKNKPSAPKSAAVNAEILLTIQNLTGRLTRLAARVTKLENAYAKSQVELSKSEKKIALEVPKVDDSE